MALKICYVAKHGNGFNDDEGAVAHALRMLGHEVFCLPEQPARQTWDWPKADLTLFNKWGDAEAIRQAPGAKAFWFWDLVDFPDPLLERRNATRRRWMEQVLPLVDLGFCTDGDWAAQYPEKLVWLPQGADERVAGKGEAKGPGPDILFFGSTYKCGSGRESFVADLKARYRGRFRWLDSGPSRPGIYGRALADVIAGAKVVVAPDAPVLPSYWSNRVYVALGYGAFLIHPYCAALASQYEDGKEILFYESREHLHRLIGWWLESDDRSRREVAAAGLARTLREHTYRHRVQTLLGVVRERLGIG